MGLKSSWEEGGPKSLLYSFFEAEDFENAKNTRKNSSFDWFTLY